MRIEQGLTADELAAVLAYWECALWSSVDDDETPMDANYDIGDVVAETFAAGVADLLGIHGRQRR